ncbi:GNAT family N-acetyltransferase (plasmid) [Streptomyces chartreusis]|uniref:GNAT family N-acetyltransferase n=1 Tax=Streptomyces chartreusis TaxID=1969 RepID=UPI0038707F19|nr:GNAT family N-acetyltransferase [Streptomyces chartreusis]
MFSGPVVYAPSLYNQYGGLPGASDLVLAEAVDQGRQLARQWSAPALLVPNLAPAEVAQWTRIRPPDTCLRLFNAYRVLIGTSGLADFVGRIPSEQARAEFRHQHHCGSALGLRLRTVSGSALPAVLSDFHTLSQHQAQREGRPALYSRAMLACLPRIPGAVALLAEKPDGALASAFLGFRHGTTLYLWAEAIAPGPGSDGTFAWLLAESIGHGADTGARVLDAGRGHDHFKQRIGFTPVPLATAIYLTGPNPRLLSSLRELGTALETLARA